MNQLYDWDNLLLAYHKASKGKRGHPDVAEFEYRLEDNLLQLQRELKEQTYTEHGHKLRFCPTRSGGLKSCLST